MVVDAATTVVLSVADGTGNVMAVQEPKARINGHSSCVGAERPRSRDALASGVSPCISMSSCDPRISICMPEGVAAISEPHEAPHRDSPYESRKPNSARRAKRCERLPVIDPV